MPLKTRSRTGRGAASRTSRVWLIGGRVYRTSCGRSASCEAVSSPHADDGSATGGRRSTATAVGRARGVAPGRSAPPTTALASCWPPTTAEGRAVVAEEQTAGRGRRGRTWLSPPGLNLIVSVALRPQLAARDAWQLGRGGGACGRGPRAALHAAGRAQMAQRPGGGRRREGRRPAGRDDGRWRRAHAAVIGIGHQRQLASRRHASRDRRRRHLAGRPGRRIRSTGSRSCGALLDALDDEIVAAGGGPIAAGALPRSRARRSARRGGRRRRRDADRARGRASTDRRPLLLDTAAGSVALAQRRGRARAARERG